MASRGLEQLVELFGQEQRCYTALLDHSRRQRAVIEAGDIDELLRLLSRKQTILLDVADIERQLEPYKRAWGTIRKQLDDNEREVLDQALAGVEELLAELIAQEKACEDLLTAKKDQAEQELTAAVRGSTAHQVYAQTRGEKEPRFLDIRNPTP